MYVSPVVCVTKPSVLSVPPALRKSFWGFFVDALPSANVLATTNVPPS
jgi:hypothetical protein